MVHIIPSLIMTISHMITTCPDDHHSKTGALLVRNPWMGEIVDQSNNPKLRLKGAQEEIQVLGKMLQTTPVLGRDAIKDEGLKRITSVALVHIAAHTNKKTGEIVLTRNPTRESTVPEKKDFMLRWKMWKVFIFEPGSLYSVLLILPKDWLPLKVLLELHGLSWLLVQKVQNFLLLLLFLCYNNHTTLTVNADNFLAPFAGNFTNSCQALF